MASKRTLKKYITQLSTEMMSQAFILKLVAPESELEHVDALLGRIFMWDDSYTKRISHPDGKDNPKLVRRYYNELKRAAIKEVGEIGAELERITETIEG